MEQHGGSIPFTILGGVQKEMNKRKKTVRRRKQSSRRRSKTKQRNRLNPKNYSVGTIIRSNGQLMKLSPNKQWLII